MKPGQLILFLLSIFVSLTVSAQKLYPIELDPEPKPVPMSNRQFYIDQVIDDRVDTTTIGVVQTGAFNNPRTAVFYDNPSVVLKEYYNVVLPREEGQEPVTIHINKLRIEERTTPTSERGWVDLDADFYSNGVLLYHTTQHKESSGLDVTRSHADNIGIVLENAVIEFNNSGWQTKTNGTPEPQRTDMTARTTLAPREPKREPQTPTKEQNGNVMALGYQIGGLSLIGFEYEVRFHDYFGANVGAGFRGWDPLESTCRHASLSIL